MRTLFLFSLLLLFSLIGSAQTPRLVLDISTTPADPDFQKLRELSSSYFCFLATSQSDGTSHWISDGTRQGTRKFDELNAYAKGKEVAFVPFGNQRLVNTFVPSTNESMLLSLDLSTLTVSPIQPDTGVFELSGYPFVSGNSAYFSARKTGETYFSFWKVNEGDTLATRVMNGSDLKLGYAYSLFVVQNKILFPYFTLTEGLEWWACDTQTGNAALIKDVNPGQANGFVSDEVFELNSRLYFIARSPGSGEEIWVSDGTEVGTTILFESQAGSSHQPPQIWGVRNSLLYFKTPSPDNQETLFISDGSTQGTSVLLEDSSHSFYFRIEREQHWQKSGYFWVNTADSNFVFFSDGSPSGTAKIPQSPVPPGQTLINVVLGPNLILNYFSDFDTKMSCFAFVNGVWKATAVLFSTNPDEMLPWANRIVVSYWENSLVPYKKIGLLNAQSEGVRFFPLDDLIQETKASLSIETIEMYGKLYVNGWDDNHNAKAFIIGDSLASPRILRETSALMRWFKPDDSHLFLHEEQNNIHRYYRVYEDSISSQPQYTFQDTTFRFAFSLNGTCFVHTRHSNSVYELWTWSPSNGFKKFYDFNPNGPELVQILGKAGNKALIHARGPFSSGDELWTTDGTVNGTVLLKDIQPGSKSSSIHTSYPTSSGMFFFATDSAHGAELWWTDGIATTFLVKDMYPGPSHGVHILGASANDTLWFYGITGPSSPPELYFAVAGTNTCTKVDIGFSHKNYSLGPLQMMPGGKLFISYRDSLYRYKLGLFNTHDFKEYALSDSCVAHGIHFFEENNFTPFYMLWDSARDLGYISGGSPENGTELWKTDGTWQGTKRLSDIHPGTGNADPNLLTLFNDTLYFSATDPKIGNELWALHTGCMTLDLQTENNCLGEPAILHALIEPHENSHVDHFWIINARDTLSASDSVFTFSTAGKHQVTLVAESPEGCSMTKHKEVFVGTRAPLVYSIPSDTLCERDHIFHAGVSPSIKNKQIQWSWGDGYTDTGYNADHTYGIPGNYTLRLWAHENGACPDTLHFPITLFPSPEKPLIKGNNYSDRPFDTFYTQYSSALTYSWIIIGGNRVSSSSDTMLIVDGTYPTGWGAVHLSTYNAFGCPSVQSHHMVKRPQIQGLEEASSELNLFPNPCSDHLVLKTDQAVPENIRVYTLQSQELQVPMLGSSAGNEYKLSTQLLPPGVYVLCFELDGLEQRQMFVKE